MCIRDRHITVQHPEWILTKGSYKFLNPGKQVVRNYVTNVIMDVVRRYDVDGIHMDDYFYPYEGMASEDQQTFIEEPRGFSSIGDWRRDNINILLRQIMDSVYSAKTHVKFGMSPFGIWKNGVPSGIIGLDAYNVIYCDALAWLRMGSIDYLTPQLYWRIGGNQDYLKLSSWWADSTYKYKRHLYPGHAPYRITSDNWSASELPNQVRIDRTNPKIDGSVFFRANTMTGKGFHDSLRTDLYRYKALLPVMQWKDSVKPNPVQNLRFERISSGGPYALQWNKPLPAPDGDSAYRYVVYRFTTPSVTQNDLENPANILKIEPQRYSFPPQPPASGPYYFVVTALDRNWNESSMSTVLQISAPQITVQVFPANAQVNLTDTITLKWNAANFASSYIIQVSSDPAFGQGFIINGAETSDTFFVAGGFEGQKTYYWRLYSKNAGGVSSYSTAFSFVTGFPSAPLPAYPAHGALNLPLTVDLKWFVNEFSQTYRLQLANSSTFNEQTILVDAADISDTAYTVNNLEYNKIYFWRISASNQYGTSQWSAKFGFKTNPGTGIEYEESIPTEYNLSPNYPNPFNPSTKISFALPREGYTTLKVYDIVGNEVAELINENIPAGKYTVNFDASDLSSGIYIYILRSGEKMMSRKMTLMK